MGKKKLHFLQKNHYKTSLDEVNKTVIQKTLVNIINSPFVTFYRAQPRVVAMFDEDGQMLADDRANTSDSEEEEEEDEGRYDDVHTDVFLLWNYCLKWLRIATRV